MKRRKVILVGSLLLDGSSLEIVPVLLTEDAPLLPEDGLLGVVQNALCKGKAVLHCRMHLQDATPNPGNASLRNDKKAGTQCHRKRRHEYIGTRRKPAMHHLLE